MYSLIQLQLPKQLALFVSSKIFGIRCLEILYVPVVNVSIRYMFGPKTWLLIESSESFGVRCLEILFAPAIDKNVRKKIDR